jgi:hypothetical protein
VNAAEGRLLDERDVQAGSEPVVVLSHQFWRRQFGEDPAIVSRVIHLNGIPVQVVGIAPRDFNRLSSSRTSFFGPISAHRQLVAGSNVVEGLSSRGTLMFSRF